MEYWSFIQKNLHFNFNFSYTYLLYLYKSTITQICFSFSPFFLNFLFVLHANTNSLSLSFCCLLHFPPFPPLFRGGKVSLEKSTILAYQVEAWPSLTPMYHGWTRYNHHREWAPKNQFMHPGKTWSHGRARKQIKPHNSHLPSKGHVWSHESSPALSPEFLFLIHSL